MVLYYCLKYSINDYSYLNQSPFSIFPCYTFCSEVSHTYRGGGGGPRFVTVCDWVEGGGQKSSKIAFHKFMDGPLFILTSLL